MNAQLRKQMTTIGAATEVCFRVVFADGSSFQNHERAPDVTILIRNARAAWRVMLFGHVGFLEAYFAGDIDVGGSLAHAFRAALDAGFDERPTFLVWLRNWWHELRFSNRSRDQAKANARFHYGLPAEFYRLWLDDPYLMYTCAYWKEGTRTLEEAQQNKMEHVCRKLRLRPGEDVIDIGTGFGGFMFHAAERYGKVDVFFNNAGIEGPNAPITEFPADGFDKVMQVNVRGVFLGMKYVAPHMQDGGSIIISSSIAGLMGSGSFVAYTTSKHAVIGIMRDTAIDLAPRGIRVNTIHPGFVNSEMLLRIARRLQPGAAASSPGRCAPPSPAAPGSRPAGWSAAWASTSTCRPGRLRSRRHRRRGARPAREPARSGSAGEPAAQLTARRRRLAAERAPARGDQAAVARAAAPRRSARPLATCWEPARTCLVSRWHMEFRMWRPPRWLISMTLRRRSPKPWVFGGRGTSTFTSPARWAGGPIPQRPFESPEWRWNPDCFRCSRRNSERSSIGH